ncbi:PH domain-containing protein [Arthrobacter sp.]|uniref:PH domain-containing protein n=1 Tax=Arthrobacter sp. TaxID=1667 RepID=UPI0026DFEC5F|nr:PH domain-containing protein [Arthrobacter sp.]MDO5752433.1 PH domain-containing protein [Arthrobacter sp.]
MVVIARTVSWLLLSDVKTVLIRLQDAAAGAGFSVACADAHTMCIDVPRALIRNRRATMINGVISQTGLGVEIRWTLDAVGNKHAAYLAAIAQELPERMLFDHGIAQAASKLSKAFGSKDLRRLANLLDCDERVHAMGIGVLGNTLGIAAITHRRVLFLKKITTDSGSLTDLALGSIAAMHTGRKLGRETLTICHAGTCTVITDLGHDQADDIARAFHQLNTQPSPAAPLDPTLLNVS